MNYGEKICHLRKSHGMTQEELGKVLNVTYQAVSKWERGESLPDFNIMSRIAKYFQVPLTYFEEDGEEIAAATDAEVAAVAPEAVTSEKTDIIGMCTECGKMLKEEEVFASSPKIICKSCAERLEKEEQNRKDAEEIRRRNELEKYVNEQLGSGFDVKLIICIVLALSAYVALTVFTFMDETNRQFIAGCLVLVPLAVFAIPYVIFDFINDLRDKDDFEGYRLTLSLIIGAVFAVINIVLFLVIYFTLDKNGYYLILLGGGTVVTFTFISQYMWGSSIKNVFTCGGFTFKLPGFIFSLSLDSIIWMIVVKIGLGILSALIFILTTILFAVVAMVGSVFTFIPFVIFKSVKDNKAKQELNQVTVSE